MIPRTAIEIAEAIQNPEEQLDVAYRTVEINGLYRKIVFVDMIILYTETCDKQGNWWDVKNRYQFEEGKFDLKDYNKWETKLIGSMPN